MQVFEEHNAMSSLKTSEACIIHPTRQPGLSVLIELHIDQASQHNCFSPVCFCPIIKARGAWYIVCRSGSSSDLLCIFL